MIDGVEGALRKWDAITPIFSQPDTRDSGSSERPEITVMATSGHGPGHWRPYLIMVQYHPRTPEPIGNHRGKLGVEHGSEKYKNSRHPKRPANCFWRSPAYHGAHDCFDT